MILLFIADGRSIHTQRWVEYFAQKGYEVHLVTYDPMNRTIPGVKEHILASWWNNLFIAFIPRQIRINKIVKETKPDLIHAHFIAKYGFHLKGLHFRPTVVTAWGDDVLILPHKSWIISHYTKKILSSANLVYAVSRDIRKHIIGDFGISASKVHYLPFGIDTDLFFPATADKNNSRETIEIFSNRGFFSVYDTGTLVQGFAQAYEQEPRLRLKLKGEGPEKQSIRNLVDCLGLSDKISFGKKTDYSEVPLDYRQADIFVTTSRSDGTPVSILEAMASGLPCVATSVGGIPEWIENNRTGLLIEPESPRQLAVAILELAADPSRRELIGTAAREVIIRRGQWKLLMVQAEKDYLDLIKTYKQDKS